MKVKSFAKFAGFSAVAMMAAMHATGVVAAPIQIGAATVVPITATVENTIDVEVTEDVRFGQVGAMNSDADPLVDFAEASIAPDGTLTDDPGDGVGAAGQASLVFDPGAVAGTVGPGVIDVTAAFQSTDLYVTYDTCVDLAGPGTEEFVLRSIVDDLATPGGVDCTAIPADGSYVAGVGTTDASGDLTFNIGATIRTDGTTDAAYTDGAYAGSVSMYITY